MKYLMLVLLYFWCSLTLASILGRMIAYGKSSAEQDAEDREQMRCLGGGR